MSYSDFTEIQEEIKSVKETIGQTTDQEQLAILQGRLDDLEVRREFLAQTLTTPAPLESTRDRPKPKLVQIGQASSSSSSSSSEKPKPKPKLALKKEPERVDFPDYDRINRHAWDEYQGFYNDGQVNWNLSNNLNFPNFINRKYNRFQSSISVTNGCDLSDENIFPHQELVKNYLAPETPYRGLLVYHGLGSGKTRTSIETALQYWILGWRIVLLVPGALKDNFIGELRKWAFKIGIKDFEAQNLRNQEIQKKLRVHIITYNHYTVTKKIEEIDLSQGKTVLIIDEVHDLISQLAKPYNKSARILYEELINIKNSKIIALTGTPIVNSGYELGILFNILRGPLCQDTECQVPSEKSPQNQGLPLFPVEEEVFEEMYINYDTGRTRNEEHFKHRIMGLVSYYRGVVGEGIYPDLIDHGIINVDLSPYVIDEYLEARRLEIEQEEKARKKVRKSKQALQRAERPPDTDKKSAEGDTFRVKTRLLSNFILPPGIDRPEKNTVPKRMTESEKERELNYQSKTVIFDPEDPYDMMQDAIEIGLMELEEIKEEKEKEKEKEEPVAKVKVKAKGKGKKVELKKGERERIYQNRIKRVLDETTKTDIFQPEQIQKYSPKFKKALQIIGVLGDPEFGEKENWLHQYKNRVPFAPDDQDNPENKDLGGLVFVYSNFRTLEGLSLFAKALEAYGYEPIRIGSQTRIENLKPGVKRYAFISGDEDTDLRTRTINIFNNPKNKYGQYIKVLLGTSASAKGISLKNLRQNIHLDPHWNEARPDQVKGRGRRICSHQDLPPEERNLHIYRILTDFSEPQKESLKKTSLLKEEVATDMFIYNIAQRKKKINESFERYLKEAAFDCDLNKAHNTYGEDHKNIECLDFGPNPPRPPKQYSYLPDYRAKERPTTVKELVEIFPFDIPVIQELGPGDKTYEFFYDLKGEPKFYAKSKKGSYETFKVKYVNPKTKEIVMVESAIPLYKDPNKKRVIYWFLTGQKNPIAKPSNVEIIK